MPRCEVCGGRQDLGNGAWCLWCVPPDDPRRTADDVEYPARGHVQGA